MRNPFTKQPAVPTAPKSDTEHAQEMCIDVQSAMLTIAEAGADIAGQLNSQAESFVSTGNTLLQQAADLRAQSEVLINRANVLIEDAAVLQQWIDQQKAKR